MLPWDQLGDPPDCTCAQVIHSRAEAFSNKWVPSIATRAYIREVAGHGMLRFYPQQPQLHFFSFLLSIEC